MEDKKKVPGDTPDSEKSGQPDVLPQDAGLTESDNVTSKINDMDTHADHLHKAPGEGPWHYFFEFLMLFLAVFCGFFAEYKLEHKIEKEKEKEFIVSMVNEMQVDLQDIKDFESDSLRYYCLDTLAITMAGGDMSQEAIKKCYRLNRSTGVGWTILFKRNTLTQLKNAGNMRLIRNFAVVDSLMGLDGSITNAVGISDELRRTVYDNKRLAAKIFDSSFFIKDGKWLTWDEAFANGRQVHFLTDDKELLMEYANNISIQKGIVYSYHRAINGHKLYSTRMIAFLKKEYNIKDKE